MAPKHPIVSLLCGWLLVQCAAGNLFAQRNLKDIPPPDPELEKQTFILDPALEVNLFAADPLLAKPIHMNFDAAGRLWIASSEVYPQIKPGQVANDKIVVLEDTNHDGTADKTTVFADGLLIPTGVAAGDGGAYVANSTELVHFADTDGDGKADRSKVVLSGFGTEDTHHILHSFRWGVDGLLYMNQSIYIHSHIETPYGVRRLDGGGIWWFRPETLELEVFCKGFVNTWGHQQDRWGQSFATDGAYGEGINYTFPGAVFVTSPGAKRILRGLNPGSPKHCGLEIISGRHFPPEWQGSMVTNDFRAHRVCRFTITENGSGYGSRQETEIIKSNHVAFRPIDAKIGPDGALYIADWYNPIIQHGEVDFRDERRDHVHGRIWRVTYKGRPLVEKPQIVGATIPALLEMLTAPEDFTRLHAKLELKARGEQEVVPALRAWVAALDRTNPDFEHRRLEALWTFQNLNVVEPALLLEVLASPEPRARAAATRVLAHWRSRLPGAVSQLATAVGDKHPRVRLEAIRALALVGTSQAAELAATAADQPLDEWLDFALWQAMRDLEPAWLPLVREGKLAFGGKVDRLTFALKAVEAPGVTGPLLAMVKENRVPSDKLPEVLTLISTLGGAQEMGAIFDLLVAEPAQQSPAVRAALLDALVAASTARKLHPAGDLSRLAGLLSSPEELVRAAAARAAGAWKLVAFRGDLAALARGQNDASAALRQAGVDALIALGDAAAAQELAALARDGATRDDRVRGAMALARFDARAAAAATAELLGTATPADDPTALLAALIERKDGPAALTAALAEKKLPADVAKRAVRAVNATLRPLPELVAALQQAGGLTGGPTKLSPEDYARLLADVAAQGDAARGEAVYRRRDMACASCHSIAGAGGRVAPDLVSIGASAPVDYLLESVLEPNKKIKENYHSLIVEDNDGRVLTGIPVRETKTELVLRDAKDAEVVIPVGEIFARREGRSLMPDGATDPLTRAELVDLIRFLSELGKVGPFSVGQARVARRWQSLVWSNEAHRLLNRTSFDAAAGDSPALVWNPEYSRVAGDLPLDDLATFKPHADTPPTSFVRVELEATIAGKSTLVFGETAGLQAWFNGQPLPLAGETTIELARGRHFVTLAINRDQRKSPVRIELRDVPDSAAKVEWVTGK